MENQQSGIKVTVRNNSSRRSINTDNNLFDFFSTLDDAKDSYINPYFLDSIFGRSERFNNVASLLQFLVRNGIEIDENIVLDAEPCLYKGENNADICSICRLSFESDQSVYNLNCNHLFHENCLKEWTKYKMECPMCRKELPTKKNE